MRMALRVADCEVAGLKGLQVPVAGRELYPKSAPGLSSNREFFQLEYVRLRGCIEASIDAWVLS